MVEEPILHSGILIGILKIETGKQGKFKEIMRKTDRKPGKSVYKTLPG